MHELAVAQSILEIILEEGQRHNLTKISAVRLQIGTLTAIVPEALSFCFDLISQETLAAGITLKIETLPVVARCLSCNEIFKIENQVYLCPRCGDSALELISGRELTVVALEGETGDNDGAD